MVLNNSKKRVSNKSNKGKEKEIISEEEEVNHSVADLDETEESEQNSDNETETNDIMPAILKRLVALEKLQATFNKKATKNHEVNTDLDDHTNNDALNKKKKYKHSPKKNHEKEIISGSEIDNTSDDTSDKDSIAVPIEKPIKVNYVDIPKTLKLKKPIYNSYRVKYLLNLVQ